MYGRYNPQSNIRAIVFEENPTTESYLDTLSLDLVPVKIDRLILKIPNRIRMELDNMPAEAISNSIDLFYGHLSACQLEGTLRSYS